MIVNGAHIDFQADRPLYALLEKLQLHEKRGIAVAVNNTVVPKSGWVDCILRQEDKVTIIKATQGG
ncbi:MAG TPA: sulfur carrier protein ThiS [Cytophagales bacterium]|nr:sulfur carrier protein ThiS [Cytophagales bacterium]